MTNTDNIIRELIFDYFHNYEILITGVGMLNICMSLTEELISNKYDLVINLGIAGSFLDKFKIGDIVEVIQDCFSEIGAEDGDSFLLPKQVSLDIRTIFSNDPKTTLRKARGITVNTIHGNNISIEKVKSRLDPDIESMEGSAVFKVCEEMKIPCIQIRSISNKVEKRNKKNWNLDLAISNLNIEVEKIISTL